MHVPYFNSKHEEVPSVTMVLKLLYKDGLLEWANYIGKRGIDYTRFLNDRANFGSLIHEMLEADLTDRKPNVICGENILVEAKEVIEKFKILKSDLKISNVQTEISMSCEDYGGTADLICDIETEDGPVKILGDFKTSKTIYDTQFVQLGAYLNLIKINMPETYEAIKLCAIITVSRDKVVMKYLTKENCEKYFTTMFLKLLDTYNAWDTIKKERSDLFKSKSY